MRTPLLLPILLLSFQLPAQTAKQKQEAVTSFNLLIGTYTHNGKSEGIYTYSFNTLTAAATLKSATSQIDNPSFLAVSADKKFVYSVNESGAKSTISSFGFDAKTGILNFINKQDSHGADPCYITADQTHVIAANYSGGSLAVFGRNADGSLAEAKQVIQHTGKSIDPKRQTSAHVHQVQFSPDKKYLICNDLGEDQIYIYTYDPAEKNNILSLKTVIRTDAGSGPRHLTFSPNGKFVYLAHEFTGGITAYAYKDGNLTKIQQVSTVEDGFKGNIDGADIHISADGKFLYESNRGDANTISVFAVHPAGTLSFVSRINTIGQGPRNFAIDPSGKYLLVAHQYTNNVVIFKRNLKTGTLTDSGKRITLNAPVCLVFTPAK